MPLPAKQHWYLYNLVPIKMTVGKISSQACCFVIPSCLAFWKLGKAYINDSRYLIKSMANPRRKLFPFFPSQGREENLFSIHGLSSYKPLFFFRWWRDRHTAAASVLSSASGHLWWHKKKTFLFGIYMYFLIKLLPFLLKQITMVLFRAAKSCGWRKQAGKTQNASNGPRYMGK